MTKTLTALTLAAFAFAALPASADMRLVLDDDTNQWVEAPAPSNINLVLDDDTRIISRGVVSQSAVHVPTPGADCTQVEASIGMSGMECGVMSNADLARTIIGMYD